MITPLKTRGYMNATAPGGFARKAAENGCTRFPLVADAIALIVSVGE